jgi:hypothetical protein
VQSLRKLQFECCDGGDALGHPLERVARLGVAVELGLDAGAASESWGKAKQNFQMFSSPYQFLGKRVRYGYKLQYGAKSLTFDPRAPV